MLYRDIETGLGEEWAGRGQLGSAKRPHWGHGFFRNSDLQSRSDHTGVAPVNPVFDAAPVAPVSREGVQMSNMGSPAPPALSKPPSSGWV